MSNSDRSYIIDAHVKESLLGIARDGWPGVVPNFTHRPIRCDNSARGINYHYVSRKPAIVVSPPNKR